MTTEPNSANSYEKANLTPAQKESLQKRAGLFPTVKFNRFQRLAMDASMRILGYDSYQDYLQSISILPYFQHKHLTTQANISKADIKNLLADYIVEGRKHLNINTKQTINALKYQKNLKNLQKDLQAATKNIKDQKQAIQALKAQLKVKPATDNNNNGNKNVNNELKSDHSANLDPKVQALQEIKILQKQLFKDVKKLIQGHTIADSVLILKQQLQTKPNSDLNLKFAYNDFKTDLTQIMKLMQTLNPLLAQRMQIFLKDYPINATLITKAISTKFGSPHTQNIQKLLQRIYEIYQYVQMQINSLITQDR